MVTSDLSVDPSDIKHLSHHGTKACILTQTKLTSNVSSQEMTACFLLASASQVLLTGPRMESLEAKWDCRKSGPQPPSSSAITS